MRTPEFSSVPAIWVVCPRAPGMKIFIPGPDTDQSLCLFPAGSALCWEEARGTTSHGCQLGLCCSSHWGMHFQINLILRKMGMFTHKCTRKGFSIGIAERHQNGQSFLCRLFCDYFNWVCKTRGISAEPHIHTPLDPDNHFPQQNKSIFISVPLSTCINLLIYSLCLLLPTPFLLLSLAHRYNPVSRIENVPWTRGIGVFLVGLVHRYLFSSTVEKTSLQSDSDL